MTILYHATTKVLTIGDELTSATSNFPDDPYRRIVEEFLESKRRNEPSRLSSWFACDKPGYAARYLEAQLSLGSDKESRTGETRLYAVEMVSPSRHPMILVNELATRLSTGQTDSAALLASEYWRPTKVWGFWEFISPKILVLKQLPWPDVIEQAAALMAYSSDSDRSKHIP